MPFCPTCKTEYRPGFNTCAECRIPLVDELEPEAEPDQPEAEAQEPAPEREWYKIYTGVTAVVERVEAYLESMHVPFVRLPGEMTELFPSRTGVGSANLRLYTVAVPTELYEQFQDQIDRAVHAGRLSAGDTDEDAEAQAEEMYDVRGCPECSFFFSEAYAVCPGCGVELVPAVEIFEDGQFEPDRVIVADGDGSDADALTVRLKEAGFDAESFEVDGWDISAVDLPWSELSTREVEIEELLAQAS